MTACTIYAVYKKVLDEIKRCCIDLLQAKQNSTHWCFMFEFQLELRLYKKKIKKNMIYDTVFTVLRCQILGRHLHTHVTSKKELICIYSVIHISQ